VILHRYGIYEMYRYDYSRLLFTFDIVYHERAGPVKFKDDYLSTTRVLSMLHF